MKFIQNIDKPWKLSEEFPLIKNLDQNIRINTKPRGVFVDVIDLKYDLRSAQVRIKSFENSEEISKEIQERLIKKFELSIKKTVAVYKKIIKSWEDNPQEFKKKQVNYSNDEIFINENLLSRDEYHAGIHCYFMNISEYVSTSITTGCGSSTYYSKAYLENDLIRLEKDYLKTLKKLKSKLLFKRIKKYIENGTFNVGFSSIIKHFSLSTDEVEIVKSERTKFPMKFNGQQMNYFASQIDNSWICIDQEFIDELKESKLDISSLLNWEVKYSSEGYMHNDGQVLDYTIEFVSPEGEEFKAYDSHSAMVGWSFDVTKDVDVD